MKGREGGTDRFVWVLELGGGDYMDMVLCTFSFGYEEVAIGTQT